MIMNTLYAIVSACKCADLDEEMSDKPVLVHGLYTDKQTAEQLVVQLNAQWAKELIEVNNYQDTFDDIPFDGDEDEDHFWFANSRGLFLEAAIPCRLVEYSINKLL